MNNFEKLGLEGIAKLLSKSTNCEDCVCWDICNDQKDCETQSSQLVDFESNLAMPSSPSFSKLFI